MALMISVSGIRGIFGSDLNPENIARFTAAYGTWLKGGKVVVGRDTRVTGPLVEDVVTAALQSAGCEVVKVGMAPTPTVAMAVLKHKADGGIIISASHNPAEWNALKLLNEKSEFLDAAQGNEVIDIAENGKPAYVRYDKIGTVETDPDALEYHIEKILELPYIDPKTIAQSGLSVAVDAVNGAGSLSVPALLDRLGVATVHRLNCEPNGLFPHNPEPIPEHLGDICEFVKETNSDLGVITDPDADRLALVTDEGTLFGEEYTQAAAFDFMLNKKPGPVATNLSSSRIADDIARRYGQKCHRSAVGEINVVKAMQQADAVIGGEGNGGVINPDLHYGRDALVGIAMVLQLLAERKLSSSEYRAGLKDYVMSKNKIQLDGLDADAVLREVESHYKKLNPNTVDGVKVDFEDGWVHLRKSNTEPIIRVYSEAPTRKRARELAEEVIIMVQKL